jgi:hypothetical protein
VGDEVLARLASLVGVVIAGEGEGALDRLPIDAVAAVGGVLADDREQVAEQGTILRGQMLGDLVDRRGGTVRLFRSDLDVATAIQRGGSPFLGR